MGILPRTFRRVEVVLDVLDVLAALEQQDLEAFLRELLRGPSAGYARSHDDGVIALRRHESLPLPDGSAKYTRPRAPCHLSQERRIISAPRLESLHGQHRLHVFVRRQAQRSVAQADA